MYIFFFFSYVANQELGKSIGDLLWRGLYVCQWRKVLSASANYECIPDAMTTALKTAV